MAWLDGWDNRLKLTIDHERIDETLTDFPLYITLASGIGRNNFDATVVFDELSPAPLYTVIFDDDFSSNDGYGWEITTATVNFNNNRLELTDTGGSHAKATTSGNLNAEDWEIRFDVTPNDFSSGDADYLLYWCYVDDVNTFQIYLNPNAGVNWLQFSANVGGVSQFAHQSTKYNYNAEGYISYTIVARKEANHFYFKHWRTGADTEPITWDYNTYVVAAWPTNGKIRCRASSAVTSYFDNITLTLISPLSYSYPYRLAITDHTGINKLPVEIECWNQYSQRASLWTKIPTISSGTDTSLYLYYDSNQLDNNLWVGYTGSAIAETVWTSEIVAAYHINTLPESLSYMRDSTQAHDATHYGSLTDANLIPSKTGLGYDFDGSDDRLEIDHVGSLALATFSFVTIFKSDNIAASQSLLSKNRDNIDGTTSYNCNYEVRLTSGKVHFRWENNIGTDFNLYSNETLLSDTWYHAVCTFNNATDYAAIYINGYLDTSNTTTLTPNTSNTQPLRIGNMYSHTSGHILFFNGVIDEVDVINEDKSAAWAKAHYFSTFDDLISYSPPPYFTASGIVYVDGNLTDNIPVRLYRRLTGELVGEATTYSGGLFEIDTPYNETHYIMSMYTTSGTNAIIYDWIAP